MDQIAKHLDPGNLLEIYRNADSESVRRALGSSFLGGREFAALISPVADNFLELLAQRAQEITRNNFGRTIQLYVPLYLSSYCSGGCTYCGFAADRSIARHRLDLAEAEEEMKTLKGMGFEEILLLTGERTPAADFNYLRSCVALAARHFHNVNVETFSMPEEEYRILVEAGCSGLTLYQETYDPQRYKKLHRWGPKSDYAARLKAPEAALASGFRRVGIGALLGLSDPAYDILALYRHAKYLSRKYWRCGVSISFPRIQPQSGGYHPDFVVEERMLARFIFAFRIALPHFPLVLSTRERGAFRNGMAGLGISKMSAASRTTVGGYSGSEKGAESQFAISDQREVREFCHALRKSGLNPVFKNWDSTYRGGE